MTLSSFCRSRLLIAGGLGAYRRARAEIVTTGFLMRCAVLSWIAFFQSASATSRSMSTSHLDRLDGLKVDWALRIDSLTAVMLVVVNTVSALVTSIRSLYGG